MFSKNSFLFVIVMLFALIITSCSSGGTVPVQDGGNPESDNDPARISGAVTIDNVPVSDVEVAAYDVTNGSLVANYTTGADGVYKLNPVGGQYLIVAVGDTGYGEPQYVNLANDGSSHQLNIRIKRFEGEKRGFLFCRVLNEEDDTPIPNAIIKFGDVETTTDAWGFCFMTGFEDQNLYQFNVRARNFKAKIHEIRRNQFDRHLILVAEFFKLSPTTDDLVSLNGVVRDIASGFDLGGVFVTLDKPNDPDFTPVTYMTNLGGVFRFYNLEKGTYWVIAQRTGFLEEESQVIINEEEGFLNVFMTPDMDQLATLEGIVYDAGGTMPLPNVMVTISNPLFGVKEETVSDGLGKFQFAGLVYGDYYIFAQPIIAIFLPQGVTITLDSEEQEFQFNLPFNESGALMGEVTVTDLDGFPTGGKVTAEKIGAPMSGLKFENNIDAYGKYAINGLLAGNYLVKVEVNYAEDKKAEAIEEDVVINAGAATVVDFELTFVQ